MYPWMTDDIGHGWGDAYGRQRSNAASGAACPPARVGKPARGARCSPLSRREVTSSACARRETSRPRSPPTALCPVRPGGNGASKASTLDGTYSRPPLSVCAFEERAARVFNRAHAERP